MNNKQELKTNTQQRGEVLKVYQRRGEEQGAEFHMNFQ
jgi:hypothetical protein